MHYRSTIAAPPFRIKRMFQCVIVGLENEIGEFEFVKQCATSAKVPCFSVNSISELQNIFTNLNGNGETIPIVCHNDDGLKLSKGFTCSFEVLYSLVSSTDLRIFLYSCYGENQPSDYRIGQINHVTDFIERIKPDFMNDTIRMAQDSIVMGYNLSGVKEQLRGLDYFIRQGGKYKQFNNHEKLLPLNDDEIAYEVVADTMSGKAGPNQHRIIAAVRYSGDRVESIRHFYSSDHYQSFVPIK